MPVHLVNTAGRIYYVAYYMSDTEVEIQHVAEMVTKRLFDTNGASYETMILTPPIVSPYHELLKKHIKHHLALEKLIT